MSVAHIDYTSSIYYIILMVFSTHILTDLLSMCPPWSPGTFLTCTLKILILEAGHSNGGDYFHSQVHNVYTRINCFPVDLKLIPFTFDATYHDIPISDRSPITSPTEMNNHFETILWIIVRL